MMAILRVCLMGAHLFSSLLHSFAMVTDGESSYNLSAALQTFAFFINQVWLSGCNCACFLSYCISFPSRSSITQFAQDVAVSTFLEQISRRRVMPNNVPVDSLFLYLMRWLLTVRSMIYVYLLQLTFTCHALSCICAPADKLALQFTVTMALCQAEHL